MRHPAYLAGTLVVAKDEQLVLHDWGAEGAPELISLEHAPLWIEVTARVEFFVAQEFVNRTVNFVGARLGDNIDDSAGEAAELRIKRVGQEAEFFY